jgi:hypothetical protein
MALRDWLVPPPRITVGDLFPDVPWLVDKDKPANLRTQGGDVTHVEKDVLRSELWPRPMHYAKEQGWDVDIVESPIAIGYLCRIRKTDEQGVRHIYAAYSDDPQDCLRRALEQYERIV